jgi:small subunit ribosomal protein S6
MLMSEYQTTVVMRPDLAGDVIESTLDRVRTAVKVSGGKVIAITHKGRQKLSYPMRDYVRGIYVNARYLGGGGLVAEVERNLRLSETVLRFLTVRSRLDVNPAECEEQAYAAPTYEPYVPEAPVEDYMPEPRSGGRYNDDAIEDGQGPGADFVDENDDTGSGWDEGDTVARPRASKSDAEEA